ncbi:pentatricopeptide repeat-containing protein At1g73400, mitochondrial [Beta vulgaris subsp. vulgaris]|uniref:pentatricopeptide repeat-containing protein At1g73400, mitochondrial n=1 Tax=Beta vulgaris subsp. vulgaris TaxID=3555 RepID=UPI002037606F|nr:pentatricopeptide repeat-containing protein At1g73400, mitochondrial [Beta vulgaris subsp. vulgaris]XP_057251883.1 pentatricopeptide repeat-containing protein At1g73400, mitochondrial [Beta vulgaris subsp. vulgaris]XP_057251884.1 pentatricopeptide repeat-containing protein At1g73400, mitochondrial [Beta vulgaris subsp. vulgaris]XP_057251885.1 pentatricopeptide repeat-containing protein At1g73400, mitochondrial [Beta vulgaris subsp. vulgaris]XP_057251886.1 pentatricopeptide repeat-containing 
MWKTCVISIVRSKYCKRSFDCHNLHNPLFYYNYRALIRYPLTILSSQMIPAPYFSKSWFGYGVSLSKFSSTSVSNDLVGEDEKNLDLSVDGVYKIVMENVGYDKNMEKALERAGIPLTTELVMQTLNKLRFEEKIAFRFFMWAARQEHYDHEYQVYNEMIDILSVTKFKAKQFKIVCDMLDYMKRNGKRSVPIEALLTILRKYTEKHLRDVMKCSKKKTRIRVKMQPEINSLNLLLDALCKCCLVEDAETLFNKVKNKILPDANTFNILFFGWCRVRNPARGMKTLEVMSSMGFTPDSFTYNAAIETFCKAGMVTKAVDLFEFMKTKAFSSSPPTAKTYAIMILALVKNDRMEDCFRVVGEMIQSGCLPDVSTYKELIEGMCLAGKVEEAYSFLEEMARKGYPSDIVTYNCFLKVLCENKKADEAIQLYRRMVDVDCVPSVHTFNMLLEMFFAMGNSEGALETWDEMEKKDCELDVNTYCVMIEGLFGCDDIENACFLLDDVVNKGIKIPYQKFDLFLRHLSMIGDLCRIHNLSEHMKKFYNPVMARYFTLNQKRKGMSFRNK